MQLRNNENAEPNSNIDEIEDVKDSQSHNSPVSNELDSSDKIGLSLSITEDTSVEVTPTSSFDAASTETIVSDASENKTTKSAKVI